MNLNELTKAVANIKKGRMVKVHYQTIKGDYTKETQTIVRFVEYSHISNVQSKGKHNPNESAVNPNFQFIIYNANKQEYYLAMATIKTKASPKVKYYYKGQEIDKATYDMANPSKPFNTPWFKKNIKDIISIG